MRGKRSAAQRRRRPADGVTASGGENGTFVPVSQGCVLKYKIGTFTFLG
jgi:hypothetical protein